MSKTNEDIIRRLFAAYPANDRATLEALLAEDFTFTSPYDDAIGRAEYFERCWPNRDLIKSHSLEKIFSQGDETFVQYLCATHAGEEFRNTEFFTLRDGRVQKIDVYFGASYKNGAFVSQNKGD